MIIFLCIKLKCLELRYKILFNMEKEFKNDIEG